MIKKIPDGYYDDGRGNMIPRWEYWYSIISILAILCFMITGTIGAVAGNTMLMQFSILMSIQLTLLKIEFNQ